MVGGETSLRIETNAVRVWKIPVQQLRNNIYQQL